MASLNWVAPLLACAMLSSCGKGKDSDKHKDEPAKAATDPAGDAHEQASADALPELGVDLIRRFNYPYGDGAAEVAKAMAAYKAKPRDWAGVRSHGEAALGKDPYQLDARRLVAAALAQDGDYEGAATHALAAVAADVLKQGPAIAADPDLAGLMASPRGAKLSETAAQLKATFLRKAASGLWLLGRRSTFKLPSKPGSQSANSRGELYAYDRDSERFLRLSQTDHAVAGALRSPSGKELVLLGFDKVVQRADATGKAIDTSAQPTLGRGYAWVLDATTFELVGKRITLPAGRQLVVGYGVGERLLAVVVTEGTWPSPTAAQWLALDTSTGKTAKSQTAQLETAVAIGALDGAFQGQVSGVSFAPSEGAEVAELSLGATKIEIPDARAALRSSLSVAPDGAHLAFAAAPDPCVAAPSLFIAEAPSGALKHVLTGKSWFVSRWLDAATLAYQDAEGAVRLFDVPSGRERLRLSERGGLALAFLSVSSGPTCAPSQPTGASPQPTEETEPGGPTDDEPTTQP